MSAFSTEEVNDRFAMCQERIVLYTAFPKVVMNFWGAFRFVASCSKLGKGKKIQCGKRNLQEYFMTLVLPHKGLLHKPLEF